MANAIADSFAAHFRRLKAQLNARMEFNLILDYDQRLRVLFLWESHSFRMDTFQIDIWQECVATHHASRVQAINTRLAEMELFLTRMKAPSTKFCDLLLVPATRSKCISCGSLEHKLPSCCSALCFLHREGCSWRAHNGNSVCFAFNSFSFCDRGTKCLHAHVCSLCRASAHGAKACSA